MKYAAQLFTLRDYTQTREDFENSLRKLKEIGYASVQLSAVGCMNNGSVAANDCRSILDDLDMTAPLTHRGWDEIKDRTDECIQFHHTIGAELVAVGSIPTEYRSEGLDGYRRFVDDAEVVIPKLASAGLKFAYHNHAFEFERLGQSAERPFDIMKIRGSNQFFFEIDTYWIVHAGIDLVDCIQNLKDRIPMVHLKDKAVVGNDTQMAPVGEGNLSWNAILKALREAGTGLAAVEQDDCYRRDPFDCLRSSLDFLGSFSKA